MIFIDENIPRLADALKPAGEVTTFSGRELTNSDLKSSGCKYLFVRSTTKLNEELLEGTEVEFIATATAGTDHFDWQYLDKTNIKCVSAEGGNSNSVAEYPVYAALKYVTDNNLDPKDLKVGVIGFGCIGKKVAKYFHDFGFRVLINDSILKAEGYQFPEKYRYGKIPEIFTECDIITNHVPLSSDSKHPTVSWFDRYWLGMMKENSLFIHTSRGKILVENDALSFAQEGKLNFALDVWEHEPDFHPELAKLCMLATAHIGAYSAQGKINGAKIVAEKFSEYSGQKIDNKVFKIENEPERFDSSELNLDEALKLLEERRKLQSDSENLVSLTNLDEGARKKGFDKLRKEYLVRFETLK
ncbi:MAG: 4-phosphoerythronate dehydrogenase PdxB [Candidatus Kapaibacteriales bacterium]